MPIHPTPRIEKKYGQQNQQRSRQAAIEFAVGTEEPRRQQPHEESAQGPAEGDGEVEGGQTLGRRAKSVEFSMQEHAGRKEKEQIEQRLDGQPGQNGKVFTQ